MHTTTWNWNATEPLNDLTFGRAVVQAEEPVLVLFWAVGQPINRTLIHQAEEVAALHGETYREYRVNLDENPFLAEHFGLDGNPNQDTSFECDNRFGHPGQLVNSS